MVRWSVLFALLAGCSSKPSVVLQLVRDTGETLLVDVAAPPGSAVSCESGGDAVVGESGHAQIAVRAPASESWLNVACAVVHERPGRLSHHRPLRAAVNERGEIKFYGRKDLSDHCEGKLAWHADTLDVTMLHCLPGTVITLGAEHGTANPKVLFSEVKLSGRHALALKLPQLKLDDLLRPDPAPVVPLPLTVQFPDGEQVSVTASGASYRAIAYDLLSSLKRGPLLFQGETQHAGDQSLLIIGDDIADLRGKAERLADVDRVALLRWNEKLTDNGVFLNKTTHRIFNDVSSHHELDVSIYDRRTGRRLADRVFKEGANRDQGVAFAASFSVSPATR